MFERFDRWLTGRMDRAFGPPPADNYDLYCCSECDSDAAALGDYYQIGPDRWFLEIMCGDCHTWRNIVATDEQVLLWEDTALNGYQRAIRRLADKIDRDTFREQAESLIEALHRDLITADDFS